MRTTALKAEVDRPVNYLSKEIVVGKRKRKRKREKKPVLTSPWKIGMMVALMLTTTGFGVGYYMVRVYDINLYWLSSNVRNWGVDSYEFFSEIYPAAAGVLIIALFTYFVIASAVRRYRYYLNSGQDYRRMISLADSIDDLTNPAQIARLSDYPELQSVLRSYGDQLREISAGIENCEEEEARSVDLEMEIDSILEGNDLNETLTAGKWWAPIAGKVLAWRQERESGADDMRKKSHQARQAAGQAALSCGRIIEAAAGAGEDVLDIARAVEELDSLAAGIGSDRPAAAHSSGGDGKPAATIESIAASLGEKGSTIRDLSEENNGLALNIALMAARGEASEKDLAHLAEKVRAAAEKFGKLGRELNDMAKSVAEICRAGGTAAGAAQPRDTGAAAEAGRKIGEIAARIESRSRALQEKMTALGNDVDDMHTVLQQGLGDSKAATEYGNVDLEEGRPFSGDNSIVNFGAGADDEGEESGGIDDSGLVIDHGKLWEGQQDYVDNGADEDKEEDKEEDIEEGSGEEDVSAEETVSDDSGEFLISGLQQAMGMTPAAPEEDAAEEPEVDSAPVDDVLPPEEEPVDAGGMNAGVEEDREEAAQDGWAGPESPGAEYEAAEVGETPVAEEAQAASDAEAFAKAPQEDYVVAQQAPAEAIDMESAGSVEESTDADEEPVFDLFELGAVEYVEESEVQL